MGRPVYKLKNLLWPVGFSHDMLLEGQGVFSLLECLM